MKKEVYYWSPFLGRVATIRSVVNSMVGLKRFNSKLYKINLINCYGEWNSFCPRLKQEKISVLNMQKKFNLNIDISGFFLGVGDNGSLKIKVGNENLEYYSIESFFFPDEELL